jgi:PPOX class probable F420-dependent enzyme
VDRDPIAEEALAVTELPEEVRAPADGRNIAHIATLMPDGAPHSVPLWIAVEHGQLAFLTSPRSQKARNLDRDPRMAISIVDADRPMRMATLRGRLHRRVDGEEGWEIIDRIAAKYIGAPYPMREDRVAFLVTVDHASAQTFG